MISIAWPMNNGQHNLIRAELINGNVRATSDYVLDSYMMEEVENRLGLNGKRRVIEFSRLFDGYKIWQVTIWTVFEVI